MDDYDQLLSDHAIIKRRCREYRERYGALLRQHEEHVERAKVDRERALEDQADEMMLLRAQLRARDEEVAALSEWTKRLVVLEPQVEALRTQLDVRGVELVKLNARCDNLKSINLKFMCEIKRLNAQLNDSAADNVNATDKEKDAHHTESELARAIWKHGVYETALNVMRERIAELEEQLKVNSGGNRRKGK